MKEFKELFSKLLAADSRAGEQFKIYSQLIRLCIDKQLELVRLEETDWITGLIEDGDSDLFLEEIIVELIWLGKEEPLKRFIKEAELFDWAQEELLDAFEQGSISIDLVKLCIKEQPFGYTAEEKLVELGNQELIDLYLEKYGEFAPDAQDLYEAQKDEDEQSSED